MANSVKVNCLLANQRPSGDTEKNGPTQIRPTAAARETYQGKAKQPISAPKKI